MVTIYGMSSRLGPIKYGTDENDVFLGRDIGRSRNYSEEVASEIDEEIRKLIGDAYSTATSLLNENIDVLHSLAKVLLEKETINSDEFDAIFQNNKNNSEVDESKIHEKVKEVREMEKAIDETIETAAGDYDEKSNDASNISSDESSEK